MNTVSDAAEYDLVVLGGGSGGYACAFRAAELGMNVALVEKDKLGGTCLHRGCIPTKALLHAAEIADSARHGSRFGVHTHLDSIDMPGVHKYKDGVITRLHNGLQGLAKSHAVKVISGEGRLNRADTISVDGREITARNVVLATGSQPRLLPGLALSERVVTSDEALTLDHVPERVVVLGGGVIGVEFASVYSSFGAEVTILEAADRLLISEDEAVSARLQRAFTRRGITVRTETRVLDARDTEGAAVQLSLEGGEQLETDLLLVAVGRRPATDDLGYAEAGVVLDAGFVRTDERLHTTAEGVYAVGDIVAGAQLAHRGFAHGIFVAEQIAGLEPQPVAESTLPRVTYCDPEVASVGLTEAQARAEHADIQTYEYGLGGNGRSQILATQGFVKVVRVTDGPVVGVHMIGARMGEQIGEAQLIVGWQAHPQDVAPLIHAHPTQNESLGEAHLALAGKPLHAHN
ncbi:dihydrolipoyl dehydrogenase [Dermacoccaceae bacterium W4C1]